MALKIAVEQPIATPRVRIDVAVLQVRSHDALLHDARIAKSQDRVAAGFCGRHACRKIVLLSHRKMRLQLSINLPT